MSDYISYWYQARVESGGSDALKLALVSLGAKATCADDPQYIELYHRDCDGFGAINYFLKNQKISFFSPVKKTRKSPSFFQFVKLFLTNGFMNKDPIPWAYSNSEALDVDSPILHYVFSEADTNTINKMCAGHGVSLSNRLMSCVNNSVCEHLIRTDLAMSSELKLPWMFPVDMRGAVSLDDPWANHSSALILNIPSQALSADVQSLVQQGLLNRAHWKLWYLGNIGKWVGRRGVRWLHAKGKKNNPLMGSCTYLGEWGVDDEQLNNHASLLFAGLGNTQYPITPSAVQFNGRLSLTLKVHASILPEDRQVSDQIRQKVLATWRELLMTYK